MGNAMVSKQHPRYQMSIVLVQGIRLALDDKEHLVLQRKESRSLGRKVCISYTFCSCIDTLFLTILILYFLHFTAMTGSRANTGDSDHGDEGASGDSKGLYSIHSNKSITIRQTSNMNNGLISIPSDDRDHSDTEETPGEEELSASGRDDATTLETFQLDVQNPDIRAHSQESASGSAEAEDPKAQGIGTENESPSRAQKRRKRRKNVKQSQRKQALVREAELSALTIVFQQNQDREMLKMTLDVDMEKVEDMARRQAELEKFFAEHLERKRLKSDEDDAKRYPHNPRSVATGPVEQPKQSSFFGTLMKPQKNSLEKAEKLREQKDTMREEKERKEAAAEELRYLPGTEAQNRADLEKKLSFKLGYFLSKYQEWMFKEASLKSCETWGRRYLEKEELFDKQQAIRKDIMEQEGKKRQELSGVAGYAMSYLTSNSKQKAKHSQ